MGEVVRHRDIVADEQEWPPSDTTHLSGRVNRGGVKLSHLFLLLCLILAVVLGAQTISGYVTYLSLREAVRLTIRDISMAPDRVEEGDARILVKARELELFLRKDQVAVTVDDEKVLARVRWQHPIGLGRYTFPLPLEIEESVPLRGARR